MGNSITDECISKPWNERIVVCWIESVRKYPEWNEEDRIHMNSPYPFTQDDGENTNGNRIAMKWYSYEHQDRRECEEVYNPEINPLFIEKEVGHECDRESYECQEHETSDRWEENLMEWSLFSRKEKRHTRDHDKKNCYSPTEQEPEKFGDIHRRHSEDMDKDVVDMEAYHSEENKATEGIEFLWAHMPDKEIFGIVSFFGFPTTLSHDSSAKYPYK